ncbi:MAG: glycosyltransferase [Alphaproteobacteria bacterium]
MRILFVLRSSHLPEFTAGLNISVHQKALALRMRGHECFVLALTPALAADAPPLVDDALGYTTIRAADPLPALAEVADRYSIDVTVVESAGKFVPILIRCMELNLPTIAHISQLVATGWGGRLVPSPFFRYTAGSPFVRDRMRVQFGIDAAVIPSLVEPDLYRVEPTGKTALFINPTAEKGAEIFFAVAERLRHVRFTVAEAWWFDEPWRNYCFKRAAQLGNIDWWPATEDMRTLYSRARVLLAPSVWEEAWARSVCEAQISGIPAIASDRGGLPESVGPGGIIVALHAPYDVWAAQIDSVMRDDALHAKLSAAARQHAARAEIQPAHVAALWERTLSERANLRLGG